MDEGDTVLNLVLFAGIEWTGTGGAGSEEATNEVGSLFEAELSDILDINIGAE